MEQLRIFAGGGGEAGSGTLLSDRDDLLAWTKWMKACPAPLIVNLDGALRDGVDGSRTRARSRWGSSLESTRL